MKGEAVGGTGEVWDTHWVISGNLAGDVVLRSRDALGLVDTLVVLIEKNGTTTVLAEEGDVPAPGPESYDAINVDISRPSGGDVALQSRLTGGLWGVFVANAGVDTTGVVAGDSGPHGTFGTPHFPDRNVSGTVVFTDRSTPSVAGVYSWSAGTATRIVAVGDPAPGTAGTFTEFWATQISDSGRIVVSGQFGAANDYGLFDYVGGSLSALVLEGQAAPFGNVFEVVGGAVPTESGDTLFSATLPGQVGLFLARAGGAIERIFIIGDPAPGVPGSILVESNGHSLNETNEIAFNADVAGGTVFSGIFLATPTTVPASLPISRGLLIVGLIVVAGLFGRLSGLEPR
jgi:hypothetical protein